MIKAIFFSTFDPHLGPTILHEVPPHSITPPPPPSPSSPPSQTPPPQPLFDIDALLPFLIPRQPLSSRLITITLSHHRILGHPVCIRSPSRYARNEFIFNFAIVLEEDVEFSSYLSVVRKIAGLFRGGEEQSRWLTRTTEKRGEGRVDVGDVCEMIMEDLNNYCECMIPVDESDTINIKLFPLYPPPPPVKPWHVPLSTVRLETVMDVNWDITMQKIVPYINGINTLSRIAELADADYHLVKKCIQHLLYYGTLLLHPPLTFSSVYAPTPLITTLVSSPSMQSECANYIASTSPPLPQSDIIALYLSLHTRLPLRAWCIEHRGLVEGKIDVRRFISFGLIKGFIYRLQRYAFATAIGSGKDRGRGELGQLLDGMHSFDEFCTEKQVGEKEVLKKLKAMGDVQIIHR